MPSNDKEALKLKLPVDLPLETLAVYTCKKTSTNKMFLEWVGGKSRIEHGMGFYLQVGTSGNLKNDFQLIGHASRKSKK